MAVVGGVIVAIAPASGCSQWLHTRTKTVPISSFPEVDRAHPVFGHRRHTLGVRSKAVLVPSWRVSTTDPLPGFLSVLASRLWQIPMEPCEIGAGGDTSGNSTICVDVASPADIINGIGVSGKPENPNNVGSS